jgi:hypothetical protein
VAHPTSTTTMLATRKAASMPSFATTSFLVLAAMTPRAYSALCVWWEGPLPQRERRPFLHVLQHASWPICKRSSPRETCPGNSDSQRARLSRQRLARKASPPSQERRECRQVDAEGGVEIDHLEGSMRGQRGRASRRLRGSPIHTTCRPLAQVAVETVETVDSAPC